MSKLSLHNTQHKRPYKKGPLTRRQFLQVSAATTGAAAMASKQASAHETVQRRKGQHGEEEALLIPSICEMCFWKCGIRGKIVDGKLVLIGSHIGENVHVSQTGSLMDGLATGTKLAVVDPRYSVAATPKESPKNNFTPS